MIEAQHIKSNLDLEPLKLQKSLIMLETCGSCTLLGSQLIP